MKYLAVLEWGPHNYSAYIPDVPGCIATGKTVTQTAQHLSEALSGFLEGETPPPVQTLSADGLELAQGDEVAWIEPAPQNPVSLELARVMIAKGLSGAEVARRMGLPRQVVSRMINPFYWGHSVSSLRRFAEAVGGTLEVRVEVAA